ncbi:hypothetical protein ACOMHN_041053 [Nucella lapillus]
MNEVRGHNGQWDSSDPFFTSQAREKIKDIVKCYIHIYLIYIGIPGNIVCCLVFWKQGLSDRINLLLFWLAVIDFFNLATQLPVKIPCYLSDKIFVSNLYVIANAKIIRVNFWCGFVSGTLIVVMSVDRCLSVVMPLRARRLLTYRSMVVAILLSYLIPLLAYLPWFLGDTVEWRVDPSTNRSMAYMVSTSLFPTGKLQTLVYNFLGIIAQPVFLIVIVTCSTITIVHLRRMSRKRSTLTGKANKRGTDVKITIMLLFICNVYVVLLLTNIWSYLVQLLVPEFYLYKKYHNSFVLAYQVLVLTASCLNSTANLFAYLALSTRFRATLRQMLFCLNGKIRARSITELSSTGT